jgi:Ala-tRNA(Pro) deacylase
MFVSQTVMGYLERSGVDFDLVVHPHSATSLQTARVARIEPEQLAKAVLLSDEAEYWLAVIPASGRVNRWALESLVDADALSLAAEEDMPTVFRDCERGALPIVGPAFGVRTAYDDALLESEDVYFEAGDHEHLVHMKREQFQRLMAGHPHGAISHRSHAHLHSRSPAGAY